jgi:spore germination protein YaaH
VYTCLRGARYVHHFQIKNKSEKNIQDSKTYEMIIFGYGRVGYEFVKTAQKKYYQVKSGDTLTRIAAKYSTTVSNLCKLNGISPSSTLVIGKNLRVK